MAGKGTMDSCDSNSSTGGSLGKWETSVPRPPMDLVFVYPPLRLPPLPSGCPPRTARPGGRTQGAPAEADPLQAVPQIKKQNPKPSERPNGLRDGPLRASARAMKPTEVPSFDPGGPPHRHPRPPARQWCLTRRQKGKGADRHSGNRIPTRGHRQRQRRRGGLRCRGRYGDRSGPWGNRHGPQQSLAWNQRSAPTLPSQGWAWSVPSSANCVQRIEYCPCASATIAFVT